MVSYLPMWSLYILENLCKEVNFACETEMILITRRKKIERLKNSQSVLRRSKYSWTNSKKSLNNIESQSSKQRKRSRPINSTARALAYPGFRSCCFNQKLFTVGWFISFPLSAVYLRKTSNDFNPENPAVKVWEC